MLISKFKILKNSLLILFFITQTAHAQPLITIVRGQDFPPYHFIDQSGKETGFIIEIIQAVADDINIKIEFKQYPWSRCLRMMELGQADAMMNLFKTEERKRFMHFSNNVLVYEVNQFFKLKEISLEYNGNLSKLYNFRIGAIRNYSYGPIFDKIKFENIYRLETEESLIQSLVHKRTEIIIGNDIVIHMLTKTLGVGHLVEPLFPIVSKAPLYIGFSRARHHKELSENFSKALHRLRKSEEHKNILMRYNLYQ